MFRNVLFGITAAKTIHPPKKRNRDSITSFRFYEVNKSYVDIILIIPPSLKIIFKHHGIISIIPPSSKIIFKHDGLILIIPPSSKVNISRLLHRGEM